MPFVDKNKLIKESMYGFHKKIRTKKNTTF